MTLRLLINLSWKLAGDGLVVKAFLVWREEKHGGVWQRQSVVEKVYLVEMNPVRNANLLHLYLSGHYDSILHVPQDCGKLLYQLHKYT